MAHFEKPSKTRINQDGTTKKVATCKTKKEGQSSSNNCKIALCKLGGVIEVEITHSQPICCPGPDPIVRRKK